MATDSSSGTSPRSSRCTIDSSSASAFSKLNVCTSSGVLSAITRRFQILGSPAHQRGNVGGYRVRQGLQVIAAFQHRYQPAGGAGIGTVHQFAGDPIVIAFKKIEVRQRIARVGVKTGRDND